jgi:hypothetical protein
MNGLAKFSAIVARHRLDVDTGRGSANRPPTKELPMRVENSFDFDNS